MHCKAFGVHTLSEQADKHIYKYSTILLQLFTSSFKKGVWISHISYQLTFAWLPPHQGSFCLTVSGARVFTQGTRTSLPLFLHIVTSICHQLLPGCSGAVLCICRETGWAQGWVGSWGFLPAKHTGTGINVLQSSTGNFSKLQRVLCRTRAAVCWPVKPASPVKKVVEQETGREVQPDTAP